MNQESKIIWEKRPPIDTYVKRYNNTYKSMYNALFEDLCNEYGIILDEYDIDDYHNIVTINQMITDENSGYPTHISIDDTIIRKFVANYGDFFLTPNVAQYVLDAFKNEELSPKDYAVPFERFEKGKYWVDILMQNADLCYFSAVAVVGATYVECGWNPGVVNTDEQAGKGSNGTGGWANAGEGLFGLTFWKQKLQIINGLSLLSRFSIPNKESDYIKSPKHLKDLPDEIWGEIFKFYMEHLAKKQYGPLFDLQDGETDLDKVEAALCASYLFKAGQGGDPSIKGVTKICNDYLATHRRMYGHAVNGFGKQMCVALLLNEYIAGNIKSSNNMPDIKKIVEDQA